MATTLRQAALVRAGYRCSFPGCTAPAVTDEGAVTLEIAHIVPKSLGGTSTPDNIIVLCPSHHRLVDHSAFGFDPQVLRSMRAEHEAVVVSGASQVNIAKSEPLLPKSSRLSLEEALKFWNENRDRDDEGLWHRFFVSNPHVLALTMPGNAFQFGEKCFLGGKDIFNRGGGIVDFLYTPSSCQGITLFEIKTPRTKLVGQKYRDRCYSPSSDIAGSVVQALHYKRLAMRHFDDLARGINPRLSANVVNVAVLAGSADTLRDGSEQKESFELFISGLRDVQIITYDDLFSKVSSVLEL